MSLQNEYHALRHAAGIIDRSSRARLVVTGADRRTYLQGLLTNDIAALTEGAGCYNAYLTPQGRMIADMRVFETGNHLLVDLAGSVAETIAARWSQFVFSEDVQIANDTASTAQVGVYGPSAVSVVSRGLAGDGSDRSRELNEVLRLLPLYGNRICDFSDGAASVVVSDDIGIRGFDIVVPVQLKRELVGSLERAGGVQVGPQAAEVTRVEGGMPLFGVDMNDGTIPLEAGIEDRAISLTKGCYVGQEVIIRVLHRGHGRVARRLVGIAFDEDSPLPLAGDRIVTTDRDIGVVTSAVQSVALGRPIALGYVHRDFVQPGTPVGVDSRAGRVEALPFVEIETGAVRVASD
jgi:folate-binding protein YgfZ